MTAALAAPERSIGASAAPRVYLRGHHGLEPAADPVPSRQVAQGGETVAQPGRVRVVAVAVDRAGVQACGGLQRLEEVSGLAPGLDPAGGRAEQDEAGAVQAAYGLPPHRGVSEDRESGPARRRELHHEANRVEARPGGCVHERGRAELDHGEVPQRVGGCLRAGEPGHQFARDGGAAGNHHPGASGSESQRDTPAGVRGRGGDDDDLARQPGLHGLSPLGDDPTVQIRTISV
ncbi:MAG TPA: hypothetical protein VKV35_10535 [Streptosporangiaceae bacterium]|nr:hypothetical protein [Streptosporangiaceae bacterium]